MQHHKTKTEPVVQPEQLGRPMIPRKFTDTHFQEQQISVFPSTGKQHQNIKVCFSCCDHSTKFEDTQTSVKDYDPNYKTIISKQKTQ